VPVVDRVLTDGVLTDGVLTEGALAGGAVLDLLAHPATPAAIAAVITTASTSNNMVLPFDTQATSFPN